MTRLAIITGPTGAGKSELAVALAEELGGEIVNADSLALYRGFDIGTAKPTAAQRARAPHHLIDVLEPDEDYDAAAYLKAARPLAEGIWARGKLPLAVGGTGFYLRALTKGLFNGPGRDAAFRAALAREWAAGADLHGRLAAVDPAAAAKIAPRDYVRLERALEVYHVSGRPISQWQREHGLAEKPFEAVLAVAVDREPADMERRWRARTAGMFQAGLVEEVEGLLRAGWAGTLKPFKAIGYKEALAHWRGEMTRAEAEERTYIATRQYARRQRVWLKGQMPEALWRHPGRKDEIAAMLREFSHG